MGRAPCCSKVGLHRGPWTSREDALLTSYIHTNGEGSWRSLPKKAGLLRCGKSCRLRWMNYLRPDIKRGNIAPEEEDLIIRLHRLLGNRWSLIAGRLPGRTDNEIKNYWNSHLSKKLRKQGFVLREAAPRGKQPKASQDSRKQNSSSSNSSARECGKIFAPKPTRLAARIATEKGAPDHDENSSREDEVSGNDWSDAGEFDVAGDYPGFLESNCRRFGFDDEISFPVQQDTVMLERLYEEYSKLLQSEGDRNLFDHQFLMV